MKTNLNRGFTLIELLVVIAIIGVLSAVVLAALTSARGKGTNSAIKAGLHSMLSQAEIVYDPTLSYNTICNATQDANIAKMIEGVRSTLGSGYTTDTTFGDGGATTKVSCHSSLGAWAVEAPLKVTENGNVYWCVDSTGFSGGRVNPLVASTANCPAS